MALEITTFTLIRESRNSIEMTDDELMDILLAPRWLPQVEGGDVVSSRFPLHGDCKVYRTRRTPRIDK